MRKRLHCVIGWVRSKTGAIWRMLAPHVEPSVVRGAVADIVRTRRELVLENALLRQQVIILRRKCPHPRLGRLDRLRFLLYAVVLPGWRRALAIVQPETLQRWHRDGFRTFWRRRSRAGNAERRMPAETVALIRKMATKNRLWGAEESAVSS